MPIPLGVSARLTNGQSLPPGDISPQQGAGIQQVAWPQQPWGQTWGGDSQESSWGSGSQPQQSWGSGAQSQQSWSSGSQPQQSWVSGSQQQQQQWGDASQQQQQQPWGFAQPPQQPPPQQNWGGDSWGQASVVQSPPVQGQEAQAQALASPSLEVQDQALALQRAYQQALAQQGQYDQALAQQSQYEQALSQQSQEMPQEETASDMYAQMPDMSALQQQQPGQPASWTNAIFDQTARELWARLQEEGHSQEECVEQFQNHMVAVYTQMQTQQQYENIADTNATVTAHLDAMQPKDPMEKLKPLFKGDEKEPHRTALGMDPLMKYYERSRNAPFGIFIGGLRTVTNEDVLVKYFSQFGEITFVEVKRLPDRTSRGFAFLHFENDDGVLKVLARKDSHLIDGKQVECKRMEPMDSGKPSKKERAKQAADAVSAHVSQFQSYGRRSQPY